ncbi:MAG: hypothetical protein IIB28_04925 [Chloroflexi bacterium]|nr:hypothetical protein [Chloroflexota bacterium]
MDSDPARSQAAHRDIETPAPGSDRYLPRARAIELIERLESDVEVETVTLIPQDSDLPSNLPDLAWLPENVRRNKAGLVVISGPEILLALTSPFPVPAGSSSDFTELRKFAARRRTVAIVLLRLGAYAVGVAVDGKLEVTKSDTRYVKGRHKAGGQSQRRFERNREKWVRELFDKACRDAKERFAPFSASIDHLALGGDRQVLNSFMKRCRALSPLQDRLLPVRVAVDRPNTGALKTAAHDLWSWRVHWAPESAVSGR